MGFFFPIILFVVRTFSFFKINILFFFGKDTSVVMNFFSFACQGNSLSVFQFGMIPLLGRVFLVVSFYLWVLPCWLRWWRICLQCRRLEFNSWTMKIPWRRDWQSTPVFLPREFHVQRSLAGYSLWNLKESDITEHFHFEYIMPVSFGL